MANQYKKLQQKIYKKDDDKKDKFKEKVGSDYLLIGVLIFTIVVTMVGWMQFDNWNRCMYVLLIVSLGLTYVRRHAKLSETQAVFAERASLVSIGFAIAMFVIVLLHNFNFF